MSRSKSKPRAFACFLALWNACGAGAMPGGLSNNREFASCAVEPATPIDPALLDLLYDPQTSGGLLISLSEADAAALESRLPGARSGRTGTAARQ